MELNKSSMSDLSDNQIKFLHKNKLSGDQLEIALAIDKEARRQGINPEFVWPMVLQESKFQQDAVSPKGATGVMQLMPDTAKGLKVDPSNLQENISGGISLLKELIQNPKIGDDPYKVLAGYNASTETRNKFYESGDLADLPDETIKHMYIVSKNYGGTLPSASFSAPEPATEDQPVIGSGDAGEENIYGGTPVTEYKDQSAGKPVEMGAMSGAVGAGLGTVYSVKAPAVRLAQRVGLLPGGKPITPTEAAQLVEKTITDAVPTSGSKPLYGGEKWQKSLTGISTPGAQMSKDSLDLAKDMQAAVGPRGAQGFTGGTITEGGIILNPRDAAAVQAKNVPAPTPVPSQPGVAQRLSKSILASSPVRGGLAGFGLGYGIQDAYNRFMDDKPAQAGLSALGTAASTAAPFMGPAAAIPLAGLGALIPAYLELQDDPEKKAKFLKGMSGKGAYADRGFGLIN